MEVTPQWLQQQADELEVTFIRLAEDNKSEYARLEREAKALLIKKEEADELRSAWHGLNFLSKKLFGKGLISQAEANLAEELSKKANSAPKDQEGNVII